MKKALLFLITVLLNDVCTSQSTLPLVIPSEISTLRNELLYRESDTVFLDINYSSVKKIKFNVNASIDFYDKDSTLLKSYLIIEAYRIDVMQYCIIYDINKRMYITVNKDKTVEELAIITDTYVIQLI